jgi:hypothetical protein
MLVCAISAPVEAQVTVQASRPTWVGTPDDDYLRLMQLTGAVPLSSLMLRPQESQATLTPTDTGGSWRNPWAQRYLARKTSGSGHARVVVFDPQLLATNNSALPFGTNDGALWQGRGNNLSLTLGAAVEAGPVTARLAPSYVYWQNREFALGAQLDPGPDVSPYADPYLPNRIDQPQRFGDTPGNDWGWGQSMLLVHGYGARAGYGTENMWWGPGMDNAILMTNNAEGFRHMFIGTDRPANIYIGHVELLYSLGALDHSGFWRTVVPDSQAHRYVNALMGVFQPRGIPGLYLGGGRVYYAYVPPGGLTFSEIRTIFEPFNKDKLFVAGNPAGNDARDQMLSLWGRWVFPQVNFEVYGEFARNDHAVANWDLIAEPGHASGYVLGFQKAFETRVGLVRASAEMTDLSKPLSSVLRDTPYWYAHHKVTQGYTQRGQVIGSGVGPGGNGQSFGTDWFAKPGSAGIFLRRWRVNSDVYYERNLPIPKNQRGLANEETFFGWGLRGAYSVRDVDLSASALFMTDYNRFTVGGTNIPTTHMEFRAAWRIP